MSIQPSDYGVDDVRRRRRAHTVTMRDRPPRSRFGNLRALRTTSPIRVRRDSA